MRVLDAGHRYALDPLDGGDEQMLVFLKREGSGYPFNRGHHGGTNCQEVLRALIDRTKYLQAQIPCPENDIILASLRSALLAFEIRAARRHGRELKIAVSAEEEPACGLCGHIGCLNHEEARKA